MRRRQSVVKLFNEQAGKCHYCKEDMVLEYGHKKSATRDHVIPKSKGGPTKRWNIVGACYDCNTRKGSMDATRFALLLSNPDLKLAG